MCKSRFYFSHSRTKFATCNIIREIYISQNGHVFTYVVQWYVLLRVNNREFTLGITVSIKHVYQLMSMCICKVNLLHLTVSILMSCSYGLFREDLRLPALTLAKDAGNTYTYVHTHVCT